MAIQQLQLADFMSFFKGNIHNYGLHVYKWDEKKKKESGTNATVKNKLLTEVQYTDHLEGRKGLGIIPINEINKCCFGVIDVDLYNFNLEDYLEAIERNNFPLVPFKSKSNGLHIYLFLKNFVEARIVIGLLTKMISYLSLDILIKAKLNKITEIFPKQYKLEKNSVGSWINLPYFNSSDTKQYTIKNKKALKLADALIHIKSKQLTVSDVTAFLSDLPFQDAPPCLQALYLLDPFRKNTSRNNYLFSFGVYLKKKDENFFEQTLFEVNSNLKNPLTGDELEKTILQSLRKKDYIYKCTESPCVDFCNQGACKKREFGVGKEYGYFSNLEYGSMTQINMSEPYYEWEVKVQDEKEFKKLRFRNEDEIIKQDVFLRLCFKDLHVLPIKMKQVEWFKIINHSLTDLKIVEVAQEDDTSPVNLFRTLFFDFLLSRAMAQNKEQILNKRVFFDETCGEYYFRVKDLLEYLYIKKNFRYYDLTEIHGLLKDFKTKPKQVWTESREKQIRVVSITVQTIEEQQDINITPLKPEFEKYEDKEAF